MTRLPYGNLLNACRIHGLLSHLRTFEGGQTIIITDAETRHEVKRFTLEYGDAGDVTDIAADWLIENHFINEADLAG